MTVENELVVGIDGGRTKTIALVADRDGNVLGSGRAGDATYRTSDLKRSMGFVFDGLTQALPGSVSPADVRWSTLGLSGADWPEDSEARELAYRESGVGGGVTVKNDAFLGLRAAHVAPPAVVIAAGTGANVAVITPDGEEWHYGAYARSGGARDVGLSALDVVYRAADGRGEATSLTQIVPQHLRLPGVDAVLRADGAGRLSMKDVFALAPLVLRAADQDDLVARRIVTEQAAKLAEYAVAAARRFEIADLALPLVLAGGLFRHPGPLLIDTLKSQILSAVPGARLVRAPLEPAVGALLYCYDALGIEPTDQLIDRLAETNPPLEFYN